MQIEFRMKICKRFEPENSLFKCHAKHTCKTSDTGWRGAGGGGAAAHLLFSASSHPTRGSSEPRLRNLRELLSKASSNLNFGEFYVGRPTLFNLIFLTFPLFIFWLKSWTLARYERPLRKNNHLFKCPANLLWPIWSLFFLTERE